MCVRPFKHFEEFVHSKIPHLDYSCPPAFRTSELSSLSEFSSLQAFLLALQASEYLSSPGHLPCLDNHLDSTSPVHPGHSSPSAIRLALLSPTSIKQVGPSFWQVYPLAKYPVTSHHTSL